MNATSALITAATSAQKELVSQGKVSFTNSFSLKNISTVFVDAKTVLSLTFFTSFMRKSKLENNECLR
jgi:hypothetical protein